MRVLTISVFGPHRSVLLVDDDLAEFLTLGQLHCSVDGVRLGFMLRQP